MTAPSTTATSDGSASPTPRKPSLSLVALGFAGLVYASALVGALIWTLVYVIQPLTTTTEVTEHIVESIFKDREHLLQSGDETIRLIMSLEGAAATARVVTLQIALASIGGFFLIVLGVLLFAVNAVGSITARGQGAGLRLDLWQLSPGMAASVMGCILIALGTLRSLPSLRMDYQRDGGGADGSSPSQLIVDNKLTTADLPVGSWYLQEAAPQPHDEGGHAL